MPTTPAMNWTLYAHPQKWNITRRHPIQGQHHRPGG